MSQDTVSRRGFLKRGTLVGTAGIASHRLCRSAEAAPPATQRRASYTLQYWDWEPANSPWLGWIKNTSETHNPGLRLSAVSVPIADYQWRILKGVAAGQVDVFRCPVDLGRVLWDQHPGLLYKLNNLLAGIAGLQPSAFFPAAYHYCMHSDAVYGIPLSGPASDCVLINVDLVAQTTSWPAGSYQDLLTWPFKPEFQTWDSFTALARALRKRENNNVTIKVAGFKVPDWATWLDWWAAAINSNGTAFFEDDAQGLRVRVYDPKVRRAVKATVAWLNDLIYKYQVSPIPTSGAPPTADWDDLVAGRAAMVAGNTYALDYLRQKQPGIRIMMLPIPQGPSGQHKGAVTWNDMLCIPRTAKNPQASGALVRFLCQEKTQVRRLAMTGLAMTARFAPPRNLFTTNQWATDVKQEPSLFAVPVLANIADTSPTWYYKALSRALGIHVGSLSPTSISRQVNVEEQPTYAWADVGDTVELPSRGDTFPFWFYTPLVAALRSSLRQIILRQITIDQGLAEAQVAAESVIAKERPH